MTDVQYDEQRCIHTISRDGIREHHIEGPTELSLIVQYVLENHLRWGRDPLLFDLSKAVLGETKFGDWLDARDMLWPVAERRNGGRTALVSRVELHDGILRAFTFAAKRRECPERIAVFQSTAAASAWLTEDDAPPTTP